MIKIDDLYDNLKEICENRKSRRVFKDIPVSDDLIEKILYIAKTSPYSSGKHNWDIIIIKDKDVLKYIANVIGDKISILSNYIDDEYVEGFKQYSSNFIFFENAPAIIFLNFRIQKSVSLMLKKYQSENINETMLNISDFTSNLKNEIIEWERDNFVKSISCVATLILLACESLGLGACFMTGPLIAEKEISQIINLKKGRNIGAIIPIGYY
jgi:nitroreductase